jgi:predicted dehydrogenase
MKEKIRFGVLGCSTIAEKSMIPAIKNSSNAQLYMIGSRSDKKASSFSKKFSCKLHGDYDEVLENEQIDAVYISLPPSLHEKWIIKAAKFGKHVICEKPGALSIKSAEKIIKECKKNHVRIIENFAFRFHPQQTKVLEIIKNNSIGKVSSFYGNYSFNLNVSQNNFRLNKKLGGGILNDVSGYLICASRLIFNENPVAVFCDLEYDDDIDVSGNIYMKYSDKTAIGSFSYKNYFQSFYNICGKNGVVQVERAFNIRDNMMGVITIKKEDKLKKITIDPYNKFQMLTEVFCNEILNSNLKKINFEKDLIDQAKIMDAARKSISEKKIIKL